MYKIGEKYKINYKGDDGFHSFFTCYIISEDNVSIHIMTVKDEDIILLKSNIGKAVRVSENDKNI